MGKEQLENIVTFCILMENGEGILSKAPSYIQEKFSTCMDGGKPLDMNNKLKYYKYFEKWG